MTELTASSKPVEDARIVPVAKRRELDEHLAHARAVAQEVVERDEENKERQEERGDAWENIPRMRRNPLQSFFRIGVHIGRDVAGKFTEAGYRSAEGLVYAEEELRNGTLSAALFEREVHLARFVTHQHADERKRKEDEDDAHDDGEQGGDARPPADKTGNPPVESLQHDRKHRG